MAIKFSIAKRGLLPHEDAQQNGSSTTDLRKLRPQAEYPKTTDIVEHQSGDLRMTSIIPKGELLAALDMVERVRLDTTTAPQLEAEFKQNIDGVEKLVLDFAGLEYLSSAGLRVLLAAQKVMNKQGEMILRNVNETINEIFEVTGFIDILTIE